MLAPAKLNLYLHVLGRRADGYHLLDSLFAFTDFGDAITVAPSQDLSVAITGPFGTALNAESTDPKQNLVWRAAAALAEKLGRPPQARINLEKNLPVASGIGGGSTDAAATLLALSDLWKSGMTLDDLRDLALQLGADVPACLIGESIFVGGIGEKIDRAPKLPPVALVLVNPGVPLSTVSVFKSRQGEFSEPARFDTAPRDARDLADLLRERRNDLTDAAVKLVPEISSVLTALEACDGALLTRMSGSGATCFGLFADFEKAEKAAAQMRNGHPHWWVAAGRLR